MKYFKIFTLLAVLSLCSCNSAKDNIPPGSERTKIKERLIGKWEVLKYNQHEKEELRPSPVPDTLLIRPDNTFRSNSDSGKWFLSFSSDHLIDSSTNIIFSKISPEYNHNKVNSYYLKFFKQNN